MGHIPLIDVKAQYDTIQTEIDAAIQNVIQETAFIGGPYLEAFQNEFASFCNLPYGVGASSGTTALHLTFEALGIGFGDEVITVPNTFIATAETITQTGAKPVFVDVLEDTLNMDPDQVESAISSATRAIVPVHLYGQIADMDPILEIARKHKLLVIEDAAQAHGAEYKKKRAGHFGVAATFSFYPGKILGAFGDAGISVTSDSELAKKMEMLSNHGRLDKHVHQFPGYNYRMDPIQSAILSVKLKHLDNWLTKRRKHVTLYNNLFAASDIQTPTETADTHHVYTYYVIRSNRRAAIQKSLESSDISSQSHYPIPLHLQPAYRDLGYKIGDFPVAETAAEQILSLPLYAEMTSDQVERVAEQVLKA